MENTNKIKSYSSNIKLISIKNTSYNNKNAHYLQKYQPQLKQTSQEEGSHHSQDDGDDSKREKSKRHSADLGLNLKVNIVYSDIFFIWTFLKLESTIHFGNILT